MNKYIVWTSGNTGEYVKADKVEELDDRILFMKIRKDGTYKLQGEYSKKLEYHLVTE